MYAPQKEIKNGNAKTRRKDRHFKSGRIPKDVQSFIASELEKNGAVPTQFDSSRYDSVASSSIEASQRKALLG